MGTQTIFLCGWGWIKCSERNIKITENDEGELFLRIKTNAIDLTIPHNFTKQRKEDV